MIDRILFQKSDEAKTGFSGKTIDENIAIVHFDSKIDMFGSLESVTSINYFKSVYNALMLSGFKSKIVFVGIQSICCPGEIIDEIDTQYPNVSSEVVWMRKDIRTIEDTSSYETQAGAVLSKILANLNSEGYTNIEVSFDLSSVKSEDAPGRSDIVTADGLTHSEAVECSYIAGSSNNVKSYIITEFNPGIESKKTGTLLMDMFKNFILGANQRGSD